MGGCDDHRIQYPDRARNGRPHPLPISPAQNPILRSFAKGSVENGLVVFVHQYHDTQAESGFSLQDQGSKLHGNAVVHHRHAQARGVGVQSKADVQVPEIADRGLPHRNSPVSTRRASA
jgi:hypothetical protein